MEIQIKNVQIHTLVIDGQLFYSCNHVYKLLGISWKGRNDLLSRLGEDTVLVKSNIPTPKRMQFAWFMSFKDYLRLLVHHGKNEYAHELKEEMIVEYLNATRKNQKVSKNDNPYD